MGATEVVLGVVGTLHIELTESFKLQFQEM